MSKLKQLAAEKGLTSEAVARETGLSISTINKWFSGEKEPYPSVIPQLCNILDCSKEDLAGNDTNIRASNEKTVDLAHKSVVVEEKKGTEEDTFKAMPSPKVQECHKTEVAPIRSKDIKSKKSPAEEKKEPSASRMKADTDNLEQKPKPATRIQEGQTQTTDAATEALKGIPKKVLKDSAAMSAWICDYANKIKQDTESSIDKLIAAVKVAKSESNSGQLSADALELAKKYDRLSSNDQEFIRKIMSKL